MSINNQISFEKARQLAKKQAESILLGCIESDAKVLDDKFIEYSEFWMFFRNRELEFSPEASLPASAAYVVSKTGETRIVADLLGDEAALEKLTSQLANYFQNQIKKQNNN
ncbi:hypothetical protein J2789_006545 [Variovorax paradoxus]|uniref:hypothetical protein n=1 Tax=Variovorax atrisoli TaxID=3394203 RepID=UPI0011AA276E|nr:hypothetical protein [Variovorax paradoxus]MDR6523843.1 hypothetical protein [Variovorax paradoxus]